MKIWRAQARASRFGDRAAIERELFALATDDRRLGAQQRADVREIVAIDHQHGTSRTTPELRKVGVGCDKALARIGAAAEWRKFSAVIDQGFAMAGIKWQRLHEM